MTVKVSAAARGRARQLAAQALYQWQLNELPPHEIEAQFHVDNNMQKVDKEYFSDLLHGVAKHRHELDASFSPYLQGMQREQLDPVTLAILRMASYELLHRIDVPYKVVINEAVNVAKKYGAEDSHKFINGVIDKTAARIRTVEKAGT